MNNKSNIMNSESLKGVDKELFDDIVEHKTDMVMLCERLVARLAERIEAHDNSKLADPEEFEVLKAIRGTKFGTPEYNAIIKTGKLEKHYKANRHHPEHFGEELASGMNLLDLIEYFLDCHAAAKRRCSEDPDFSKLAERHGLSEQLAQILNNSADLVYSEVDLREWIKSGKVIATADGGLKFAETVSKEKA